MDTTHDHTRPGSIPADPPTRPATSRPVHPPRPAPRARPRMRHAYAARAAFIAATDHDAGGGSIPDPDGWA